jgi:hypothetical protein
LIPGFKNGTWLFFHPEDILIFTLKQLASINGDPCKGQGHLMPDYSQLPCRVMY